MPTGLVVPTLVPVPSQKHHDAPTKRLEEEYNILGGCGGIFADTDYGAQENKREGVVRRTDTFECVGLHREQMF